MNRITAVPQTRRAWSLGSSVGPLTTLPILAIALVALLAPINVLDQSELLTRFVATVRNTLLGVSELADIRRFADSTSFPQVALLTVALHWFLLPIQVCLTFLLTELSLSRRGWVYWTHIRDGQSHVTLQELLIAIASFPAYLAGLVVVTMVPGDWSLVSGLTTQSRVGMTAVLLVGFWLAALVASGSYAILRAFLRFNLFGSR